MSEEETVDITYQFLIERINSLEQKINTCRLENYNIKRLFEESTETITDKINNLENFKHVRFTKYQNNPHVCPLCEGTSFDKEGMECKACSGTCIVWG